MAHIAATAEISPGLIYRYFKSKSAIVRAIIERHLESDGCRLVDGHHAAQPLCEGLLEVFDLRKDKREDLLASPEVLSTLNECTLTPHHRVRPVFGSSEDARQAGYAGV